MPAPDPHQPLQTSVDAEGHLLVTVPRDPARTLIWTVRPDTGAAQVMVTCDSPEEVDVWMVPFQRTAVLVECDNPALALSLYHTSVVNVVPQPIISREDEPPTPRANLQSPAPSNPEPIVKTTSTVPHPTTPQPDNRAILPKSSLWTGGSGGSRAVVRPRTPPPAKASDSAPVPAPTPVLSGSAPWWAAWVMQVGPRAWALWRFQKGRPDWLWGPNGRIEEWPSLSGALEGAADHEIKPVFWTPRSLVDTARRSPDRAPFWYLGQLQQDAYCLWHPTVEGFAVLSDVRRRLILASDISTVMDIARSRGTVAVYTPSGVWSQFLHAQAHAVARLVPGPTFQPTV